MIVCLLYALFPICYVIVAIRGYDLVLCSYPISIITITIVSIAVPVLLVFLKISLKKTQSVLSAFLLPLSVINGIFFVLASDWNATFIFILICSICSILILVKFAHPIILKVISAVLSSFLILLLIFMSLIDFIFADFGCNTIVMTLASPQNTYVAEVIDNDQGALGGNTIVNVRNNSKSFNLFICEISKPPIRIYTGEWREFENMQISWKDDNTIIINGEEYNIKD